jgi:hypothetical protein
MGRVIKLFGERNSGTRAVKQVLRNANDVSVLPDTSNRDTRLSTWHQLRDAVDYSYQGNWRKLYKDALLDTNGQNTNPVEAWTHAAPNWNMAFLKNQIDVIFMIRNPYSWALSTACKPYQLKGPKTASFTQFITRPWLTELRDNVSVVLPSVIDLWTTKLTAYCDFTQIAAQFGMTPQFVPFEVFAKAPEQAISGALHAFGIPATGLMLSDNHSDHVEGSIDNTHRYYTDELWKKRLTRIAVGLINDRLDWDLAEHFGYEKLDPADFPEKLPQLEQWRFSHEMMNLNPQPNLMGSEQSHGKRRATPAA